ncbi:MAG: hypothetical protein ABI353_06455 [Isosphaeraceae bacterium]
MRHSDPSLTTNLDTDPKLLDVHGGFDAPPGYSLDTNTEPPGPTRTAGVSLHSMLPGITATGDNRRQSLAI